MIVKPQVQSFYQCWRRKSLHCATVPAYNNTIIPGNNTYKHKLSNSNHSELCSIYKPDHSSKSINVGTKTCD